MSSFPGLGDGSRHIEIQGSEDLRQTVQPVWFRVQVRVRAAVVGCELGEKGADETRSLPDLRERTHANKTPRDIEGKHAKAFRNVRVLRGQLSIFVLPLHRLLGI